MVWIGGIPGLRASSKPQPPKTMRDSIGPNLSWDGVLTPPILMKSAWARIGRGQSGLELRRRG